MRGGQWCLLTLGWGGRLDHLLASADATLRWGQSASLPLLTWSPLTLCPWPWPVVKARLLHWDSSEAPARRGGGLGTCGSLPGTRASLSAFSEAFHKRLLWFPGPLARERGFLLGSFFLICVHRHFWVTGFSSNRSGRYEATRTQRTQLSCGS